jgi:hypothetical protein
VSDASLPIQADPKAPPRADALFAPLLQHVTINSSPDRGPVTHESAFYPSPSAVLLHSHSASAPFLPPPPASGMTLNYWSDPSAGCSATSVRIRLAWRASASRLILRYRMTVVAWSIGVVGAISAMQARHYRVEGEPATEISLPGWF